MRGSTLALPSRRGIRAGESSEWRGGVKILHLARFGLQIYLEDEIEDGGGGGGC